MPPAKKKSKKLASSSNAGEPSSSGSADPPVQKKRGRPRKIVVKEEEEDELEVIDDEEIDFKRLLGDQPELLKRAKLPAAAAATPAAIIKDGNGVSGKILPEAKAPAAAGGAAKRDGRRRKSEPHRAPGVLVEGLL